MKICFFFILEGPTLERQALLLADSIRQHHSDEHDCIAYVPNGYSNHISQVARDFLQSRNVQIVPLNAHKATWKQKYPHGNKILAAAQQRDADYSIFLDTDTCCTAPIIPNITPRDKRVFAVAEGVRSWGSNMEDWEKAYGFFGLQVPKERVSLAKASPKNKSFVPYFNAGYVAFPEVKRRSLERFGNLWLQTAVAMDFGADIPRKRPWLDQISLPITMYRFGFAFHELHTVYNFSTKGRGAAKGEPIRLAHYHRGSDFLMWKPGRDTFDSFKASFTSTQEGRDYFEDEDSFLKLMVGRRRPRPVPTLATA